MELFEKYAFVKAYSKFLEVELKKVREENGFLQSEKDELQYLPLEKREALIKEEMYSSLKSELKESKELFNKEKAYSTDLLFKLNKTTTKLMSYDTRKNIPSNYM
jgi:hypothetical protein